MAWGNVSTTEVEGTVSSILDLKTTTAYGVRIPNMDGRAGMVAVVVEDESEVNFDKLRAGVVDKLPNYARPLFVRLLKDARMTSEIFPLICSMLRQTRFKLSNVTFTLQARSNFRRICYKKKGLIQARSLTQCSFSTPKLAPM